MILNYSMLFLRPMVNQGHMTKPSRTRKIKHSNLKFTEQLRSFSKDRRENILLNMSRLCCPFLARQSMTKLRAKSSLFMKYAPKCPFMSRVLNSVHSANHLHSSGIYS